MQNIFESRDSEMPADRKPICGHFYWIDAQYLLINEAVLMQKLKIVFALFAAFIFGCANRGSNVEGEFKHLNTVDLTVVNVLEDSYRIYFVPYANSQVYLGRVSAGETRKFRIKLSAERNEDTKLLAISTHRTFGIRPIEATLLRELRGGDLIRWELNGNHLEWIGVVGNEN